MKRICNISVISKWSEVSFKFKKSKKIRVFRVERDSLLDIFPGENVK